jgi:hypothetical protein
MECQCGEYLEADELDELIAEPNGREWVTVRFSCPHCHTEYFQDVQVCYSDTVE